MVDVKLIHILAADHVYFGIPILINRLQLLQLLELLGGKAWKVGGNQGACGAHQIWFSFPAAIS